MVFLLKKAAILAGLLTILGFYFMDEMRSHRPNSTFTNPRTPSDSSVTCNCQLITKCLSSLKPNETPRFCGYEGIQRKICCDPNADTSQSTHDSTSGSSGAVNAFLTTAQIQAQAAKFYRNQFLYNNERMRFPSSTTTTTPSTTTVAYRKHLTRGSTTTTNAPTISITTPTTTTTTDIPTTTTPTTTIITTTEKIKESRILSPTPPIDTEALKKIQKQAGSFLAEYFPEYYNDLVKNLTKLDNVTFIEDIPVPKEKTNNNSDYDNSGNNSESVNETENALKRLLDFNLNFEDYLTTASPTGVTEGYYDDEIDFDSIDLEQFLNITGLTTHSPSGDSFSPGEFGDYPEDNVNLDSDYYNLSKTTTTERSPVEPDNIYSQTHPDSAGLKGDDDPETTSQMPVFPSSTPMLESATNAPANIDAKNIDETVTEAGESTDSVTPSSTSTIPSMSSVPPIGNTTESVPKSSSESVSTTLSLESLTTPQSFSEDETITYPTSSGVSTSAATVSSPMVSTTTIAPNGDTPEFTTPSNPDLDATGLNNTHNDAEDSPSSDHDSTTSKNLEPSILPVTTTFPLKETTPTSIGANEDSFSSNHSQNPETLHDHDIPPTTILPTSMDDLMPTTVPITETNKSTTETPRDNKIQFTEKPENVEIPEISTTTSSLPKLIEPVEVTTIPTAIIMNETSQIITEDVTNPTKMASPTPTGKSLLQLQGVEDHDSILDDSDINKIEGDLGILEKEKVTNATATSIENNYTPTTMPPTSSITSESSYKSISESETTTTSEKMETQDFENDLPTTITTPISTSISSSPSKSDLSDISLPTISSSPIETTPTSNEELKKIKLPSSLPVQDDFEDMISTTENSKIEAELGNDDDNSYLNKIDVLNNEVIQKLDESEITTTMPQDNVNSPLYLEKVTTISPLHSTLPSITTTTTGKVEAITSALINPKYSEGDEIEDIRTTTSSIIGKSAVEIEPDQELPTTLSSIPVSPPSEIKSTSDNSSDEIQPTTEKSMEVIQKNMDGFVTETIPTPSTTMKSTTETTNESLQLMEKSEGNQETSTLTANMEILNLSSPTLSTVTENIAIVSEVMQVGNETIAGDFGTFTTTPEFIPTETSSTQISTSTTITPSLDFSKADFPTTIKTVVKDSGDDETGSMGTNHDESTTMKIPTSLQHKDSGEFTTMRTHLGENYTILDDNDDIMITTNKPISTTSSPKLSLDLEPIDFTTTQKSKNIDDLLGQNLEKANEILDDDNVLEKVGESSSSSVSPDTKFDLELTTTVEPILHKSSTSSSGDVQFTDRETTTKSTFETISSTQLPSEVPPEQDTTEHIEIPKNLASSTESSRAIPDHLETTTTENMANDEGHSKKQNDSSIGAPIESSEATTMSSGIQIDSSLSTTAFSVIKIPLIETTTNLPGEDQLDFTTKNEILSTTKQSIPANLQEDTEQTTFGPDPVKNLDHLSITTTAASQIEKDDSTEPIRGNTQKDGKSLFDFTTTTIEPTLEDEVTTIRHAVKTDPDMPSTTTTTKVPSIIDKEADEITVTTTTETLSKENVSEFPTVIPVTLGSLKTSTSTTTEIPQTVSDNVELTTVSMHILGIDDTESEKATLLPTTTASSMQLEIISSSTSSPTPADDIEAGKTEASPKNNEEMSKTPTMVSITERSSLAPPTTSEPKMTENEMKLTTESQFMDNHEVVNDAIVTTTIPTKTAGIDDMITTTEQSSATSTTTTSTQATPTPAQVMETIPDEYTPTEGSLNKDTTENEESVTPATINQMKSTTTLGINSFDKTTTIVPEKIEPYLLDNEIIGTTPISKHNMISEGTPNMMTTTEKISATASPIPKEEGLDYTTESMKNQDPLGVTETVITSTQATPTPAQVIEAISDEYTTTEASENNVTPTSTTEVSEIVPTIIENEDSVKTAPITAIKLEPNKKSDLITPSPTDTTTEMPTIQEGESVTERSEGKTEFPVSKNVNISELTTSTEAAQISNEIETGSKSEDYNHTMASVIEESTTVEPRESKHNLDPHPRQKQSEMLVTTSEPPNEDTGTKSDLDTSTPTIITTLPTVKSIPVNESDDEINPTTTQSQLNKNDSSSPELKMTTPSAVEDDAKLTNEMTTLKKTDDNSDSSTPSTLEHTTITSHGMLSESSIVSKPFDSTEVPDIVTENHAITTTEIPSSRSTGNTTTTEGTIHDESTTNNSDELTFTEKSTVSKTTGMISVSQTRPVDNNSSVSDDAVKQLNDEIVKKLDHVEIGVNMSTTTETSNTEKYIDTVISTTATSSQNAATTISSIELIDSLITTSSAPEDSVDEITVEKANMTTKQSDKEMRTTTLSSNSESIDMTTTIMPGVPDSTTENSTQPIKPPLNFMLNITEIFREPGSDPVTSLMSPNMEQSVSSTTSSSINTSEKVEELPSTVPPTVESDFDIADKNSSLSFSSTKDETDNNTSFAEIDSPPTTVPPGLNDLEFVPDYPEQFMESDWDPDSDLPNTTDSVINDITTEVSKEINKDSEDSATKKSSPRVTITPRKLNVDDINDATTARRNQDFEESATTSSPKITTSSPENSKTERESSAPTTTDNPQTTTTENPPTTTTSPIDTNPHTTPTDNNPTNSTDNPQTIVSFIISISASHTKSSKSKSVTETATHNITYQLSLNHTDSSDPPSLHHLSMTRVSNKTQNDSNDDQSLVFDETTSTRNPSVDAPTTDTILENAEETTTKFANRSSRVLQTTTASNPKEITTFLPDLNSNNDNIMDNETTSNITDPKIRPWDLTTEKVLTITEATLEMNNDNIENITEIMQIPENLSQTPTTEPQFAYISSSSTATYDTTTTDRPSMVKVPQNSISSDDASDFADLFTSNSKSNSNSSLILDIIMQPLLPPGLAKSGESSFNALTPNSPPRNKTEEEISLLISTGRGNRSLTNIEAIDLAKELGSHISNVVDQLLLTTHKNFHLLPLFTECANAKRPRKKSRVLNLEYEHLPHVVRIGAMEPGGLVYSCAGTLISKRYVLTSAQCLQNKFPVTTTLLEDEFTNKYYVDIESIALHPKFSNQTLSNDIALVRLKQEQAEIKPICLPFEDAYGIWESIQQNPGDSVTLSGWTKKQKKVDLDETSVDIIPQTNCTSLHKSSDFPSQICTTSPIFFPNYFTRGSPLTTVMTRHKLYFQIGLLSNYNDHAQLHTRIATYLPWILDSIKE